MPVTVTTDRGEFTGATIAGIIDREYGHGAHPAESRDPNDPIWGRVLREVERNQWQILDRIIQVEGDEDTIDLSTASSELRECAENIEKLENAMSEQTSRRDNLIREMALAGARKVDLVAWSKRSRAQVDNIINRK